MRDLTLSQAINEALAEELERDPRVFLIGEDIGLHGGAFGVTKGLFSRFGPDRVRNTPISEAAIAGAAVGSALVGARPVAELMYIDFITIAMDQIVNQGAKVKYMFGGKARVPMVLRAPFGAGRANAAQHSQSLEAWLCHVPGLKVVMPSTPADAKGLLKSAIRDDNLVVFLENKHLYFQKGPVPEGEYAVPLGVADIKRPGRDVTVVATARQVHAAISAAEALAKEGIEVEVLDPRTLWPLDTETIIASVKKTGRLVTVHEAVKRFGFGAEVAAIIAESEAFDYLDAPIRRVAGAEVPVPFSKSLEDLFLPDEHKIIDACKAVLA
ncbi:MAG: alpha-ketoacid dehydrogenase subunit beta [Deltaproteobacteria bacterium]|nr:MAG: alpha-ketoacid dehydrogenase subunit beta [Deltaproteobacteria bacterium]